MFDVGVASTHFDYSTITFIDFCAFLVNVFFSSFIGFLLSIFVHCFNLTFVLFFILSNIVF